MKERNAMAVNAEVITTPAPANLKVVGGSKDPAKKPPTGTAKVTRRSDKAVVVKPGIPAPEVIDAHIAALNAEPAEAPAKAAKAAKPRKAKKATTSRVGAAKPGATVADLVVSGDPVEFWTRRVRIWKGDVAWAELPAQAANTARITARKARLAEGERMLAAAVKAAKAAKKGAAVA